MAAKKKQLARGVLVNQLTLSRDGKFAAGHTSASQGGTELCVVEVASGIERRLSLESPFTRVAAVDFLGEDLLVAALHDVAGEHLRDNAWTLLRIDPAGVVTRSGPLVTHSVSGALAVGPEGQVALVVATTLFVWKPGELLAGKPPQRLELEVDEHFSQHAAWTATGELLVLAFDRLVELSRQLKARVVPLADIEAHGELSISGDAVSFCGSWSDAPGPADATRFIVDRKTGAVTAKLDSLFHGAHLAEGSLRGASGGKTWLKKKGWKQATRTPELQDGYVMRVGLDGAALDVVPMKLGRVDAFVSAGDVVLVGSDKGLTWLSGVFPTR